MGIAALDVLLHPSLRSGTPETLRLARMTAAICVVLLTTVSLIIPLILIAGDPMSALDIVFSFTCYCIALGLLRFRGDRIVAAHVVTSGLLFALANGLVRADGTRSGAFSWLALVPMLAVMFLGARAATIWTLGTCAIGAAVAVRELLGFPAPISPDLGTATTIVRTIVQLLQVGVFFAIARSFDAAKNRMAEELESERRVTQKAHDEASEAHRSARRVLDSVDQALFSIGPDGVVSQELSSAARRWFGAPAVGATVSDWLARTDPEGARWLAIAWAQHQDGFLPIELTLAQLPTRLHGGGRTYSLRWLQTDRTGEVLVVASDVTDAMHAEQEQSAQREIVALLARCLRDPDGVAAFVHETSRIVAEIARPCAIYDPAVVARSVHTLKGNAAVFELRAFTALCHGIEERMAENDGAITPADRAALGDAWHDLRERMAPFLDHTGRDLLRIPRAKVMDLVEAAARHEPHAKIERTLRAWTLEPARTRLERAADQARALASRLGRVPIEIHVQDHGVALNAESWGPFWAAFAHAIRNAVDHGTEPHEQRVAHGKEGPSHLWLETRLDGLDVVVSIRDDGPGIDWSSVAQRARERGLPHQSSEDLTAALFADGLSTAREVTDVSGRGVGMAALREVTAQLGGDVVVQSARGEGTTLELRVPAARDELRAAA